MNDAYLRRFDWIILKPSFVLMLVLGCGFVLHTDWALGTIIYMLAVFGIGAVGAALHRERSTAELLAGYPHRTSVGEKLPDTLDHDTSFRIAKAAYNLGIVFGITAGVVGYHFGYRWYFIVLFTWLAWISALILSFLFMAVVGWRTRNVPNLARH